MWGKKAKQTTEAYAMRMLDEHYRMVYGLCYRLALDRARACTLAHEAFLEFFGHNELPVGFEAQRRALYAQVLRLVGRALPAGPVPATELELQEEPEGRRWMLACLSRLDLRQREAFLLKYYALYQEEQIAAMLGCGQRELKALLERALVEMLPGQTGSPSKDMAERVTA